MGRKEDDGMFCRSVLERHNAEWDARKAEIRQAKAMYETRFWEKSGGDAVRIEVGDGRAQVDQFVGSLFTRAPSVEVGMPRSGDAPVSPLAVQAFLNEWLVEQREEIERATRAALMFPGCAVRVSRVDGDLVSEVVMPWDLLCDLEAPSWRRMRWVGHRYALPLSQAKVRWPGKRWSVLSSTEDVYTSRRKNDGQRSLPEGLRLVEIIEVYDLTSWRVLWWSPSLATPGVLDSADAPMRYPGKDRYMHPYLHYAVTASPDAPVRALSSLSAVMDQIREKLIVRSAQAAMTRRQSRQWVYPEDALSEEQLARITAGEDGAAIALSPEAFDKYGSNILAAVQQSQVPPDLQNYVAQVEQDLAKGSIIAAFARGEATKSTATEIGVLAQYSSSELGRLARGRDAVIEGIALQYLANRCLESQPLGKYAGELLTPDDLNVQWQLTALDQAGTPISRAIERNTWMSILPVLQQLGVGQVELLKRTIRLFDLPAEWAEVENQPQPQGQISESAPDELPPGAPAQQGSSIADILSKM